MDDVAKLLKTLPIVSTQRSAGAKVEQVRRITFRCIVLIASKEEVLC